MKCASKAKIELIACKDETRYHLVNIHYDTEKKVLVATNGHRMAVVPVDEIDAHDTSGPVTVEAFKAARKAAKKNPISVVLNGAQQIEGGPTFPRPTGEEAGKFPPWEQVVPSFKEGDEGTVTFGFNAHYLYELAQAIGSENSAVKITVQLPAKGKQMIDPIRVEGGDLGAYGVLMPMRI